MGIASKVVSVIFRTMEIISAAVVLGLVGEYLHYTSDAHIKSNQDLVYTEVLGGLSLAFALLMVFPFKFQFYAFALDFAMFIMWMVSFGLLRSLAGGKTCNSTWYWQNWGWYYGGYQYYPNSSVVTQSTVGTAGCSKMLTVLAFAFIGGWFWLLSGCVGAYVTFGSDVETKRLADNESGDSHEVGANGDIKKRPAVEERDTGAHFFMGTNMNVVSPEGPTPKI